MSKSLIVVMEIGAISCLLGGCSTSGGSISTPTLTGTYAEASRAGQPEPEVCADGPTVVQRSI